VIKVDKHISELLYEHDCVIVPELGGFLASYASSEIHPVQHTFSPPSKKVAFNALLKQNDGLLASYVAQTESFTYNKALKEIEGYVENCMQHISKGNKFTIERVGTLFKNVEGNLQFEPTKNANYLKDSFGLVSIQFLPIEQLQQQESRKKVLRKSVELPKAKTTKVSRKKVFNTVLIGTLAIWICFNAYIIISPSQVSVSSLSPVPESAKVEPPVKTESVVTESKTPEKNILPAESTITETAATSAETSTETKVAVPEVKQQAVPQQATSGNKYFLIGGAFRSAENAVKFSDGLKADGFIDAHILNEKLPLKMVCYSGFSTMEEARAEKTRLKSMQKDAWIYRD
jgi:cell division septation protein DedD